MCLALLSYAGDNKGKFPPNIAEFLHPTPDGLQQNWWCDPERIGRYLRSTHNVTNTSITNYRHNILAPVLVCPEDEGAGRSYGMNFWASCVITIDGTIKPAYCPKAGATWNATAKESTKLMLVMEVLSRWPAGVDEFMSDPVSPNAGGAISSDGASIRPGWQFVGDLGLNGNTPGLRYRPSVRTDLSSSR